LSFEELQDNARSTAVSSEHSCRYCRGLIECHSTSFSWALPFAEKNTRPKSVLERRGQLSISVPVVVRASRVYPNCGTRVQPDSRSVGAIARRASCRVRTACGSGRAQPVLQDHDLARPLPQAVL